MAYTVGATSTDKKTMESTARTNPSGNITTYGNGVSVHTRATPPNAAPATTGLIAGGAVPAAAAAAQQAVVNTANKLFGSAPAGQQTQQTTPVKPTGDTWEDANALNRLYPRTAPINPVEDDNKDDNKDDNNNYTPYGSRTSGGGGGGSIGGSYTAPVLPHATSQEAYIRSMYDANERAARENLRAEYENNIAALDRAQGRLPDTYNTAVDQANTQAAINRANFNEAAAANGLNTGAGSQVRLSQNNALQGNVASIRKAQADAQSDLDFQRTQLEAQYQQAIRKAIADNDMQRAQALYQEARRVDESIVNTAVNQANLNWNVWRALYG